jgi:hypothetical protein
MKISLVGGSSEEWSKPFNAARCVNMFPVVDKGGSEVSALYGTPGLDLFATAGFGPVRGELAAANGRAFVVSDARLFELGLGGTATPLGSLDSSAGIVTMADNGFQLAVCDGDKVYIFTYLTNIFEKVTDPDLPSAGGIDFVNGYFVINENNSGKFYISGLYDGLSWGALDFASAESSPDNLTRAVSFVGQLGLFGANTLEIWRNTGDSVFPFSRISGATPIGCTSPETIRSIDTSQFWVGSNDEGSGIVYKAQGFNPTRVSTNAIELKLQAVADPTALYSWHYQKDGHVFYVISGSDLETSLALDISTELWHELAYSNEGIYEQHLASCCMYAFGKHLVGDRNNGNIYELSKDVYTDNGNYIKRLRVYTHLIDELKQIKYSKLKLLLESGVGLQSGQGSDPLISLRISKDGAITWGNTYSTSMGAVGKYQTDVEWRRLGVSQVCTFEISTAEPVKIAFIGSYLN